MLRNNLTKDKIKIPFIKIEPHPSWKGCMVIESEKNFSIEDLFYVFRSYSDSLTVMPFQMLVKVEDNREFGRTFFTQALTIERIKRMSVNDFVEWYSDRWMKDSEYMGHENFAHVFLFKFISVDGSPRFPIWPWIPEHIKEIMGEGSMYLENIMLKKEIEFLKKKVEKSENKKDKPGL